MRSESSLARSGGEPQSFGDLLRAWRTTRKVSQLDLALDAGVSQRHVSFLESGRAQPSREMVLQLAGVLDVPLRDRNVLLQAAGFASLYRQRALEDRDMSVARQALEMMLAHHEPFPAMVVDRGWDVVLSNRAAASMFALLGDPGDLAATIAPGGRINVMRATFHPRAMQPLLRNWEHVATFLLSRLQREVAADPSNGELRALLHEIVAYPGIPASWPTAAWTSPPPPILALEVAAGDRTLRMFTMISTFGTAQDVTADELRVEMFFPADEVTAEFFRALVATGG